MAKCQKGGVVGVGKMIKDGGRGCGNQKKTFELRICLVASIIQITTLSVVVGGWLCGWVGGEMDIKA